MPDSIEAATIFALLIVPGYSFLAGFRLGRSHTLPDRDLYVVAQAVVVSVILVALGWFRIEDLLEWLEADTVGEHPGAVLVLLLALIAGPFALARALAWLVKVVGETTKGLSVLKALGVARSDAWQTTWATPLKAGASVVINLENGGAIFGQVDGNAVVDFSPLPPAVYLAVAYRQDAEGQFIPMDGGAFIPGEQISAVYLANLDSRSGGGGR